MAAYAIQLEPWSDVLWHEMKPHAEAHSDEVDSGVEPRRRFKLDEPQMAHSADMGSLKIIIARKHGSLVGYFTWGVGMDIESEDLMIAIQGAWYVERGHWGLAVKMFHVSVLALKSLGVQCIFPHHRTQGRGAHLGRFFERCGAKKIQETYSLWIGT